MLKSELSSRVYASGSKTGITAYRGESKSETSTATPRRPLKRLLCGANGDPTARFEFARSFEALAANVRARSSQITSPE